MIVASIVVGLIGLAITRSVMARMSRDGGIYPADAYWLLGMGGILPAWLVLFVGLLERMSGRTPKMSLALWWVLSSAAGLGGAIITHGRLRRHVERREAAPESDDGPPPRTFWRLGIVALLPAWCLALIGLVMAATTLRSLR